MDEVDEIRKEVRVRFVDVEMAEDRCLVGRRETHCLGG